MVDSIAPGKAEHAAGKVFASQPNPVANVACGDLTPLPLQKQRLRTLVLVDALVPEIGVLDQARPGSEKRVLQQAGRVEHEIDVQGG